MLIKIANWAERNPRADYKSLPWPAPLSRARKRVLSPSGKKFPSDTQCLLVSSQDFPVSPGVIPPDTKFQRGVSLRRGFVDFARLFQLADLVAPGAYPSTRDIQDSASPCHDRGRHPLSLGPLAPAAFLDVSQTSERKQREGASFCPETRQPEACLKWN